MQYYNNDILCLEFDEFVPHILKRDNFYHHRDNGNIIVHGRGGNGAGVLIEYESIILIFFDILIKQSLRLLDVKSIKPARKRKSK